MFYIKVNNHFFERLRSTPFSSEVSVVLTEDRNKAWCISNSKLANDIYNMVVKSMPDHLVELEEYSIKPADSLDDIMVLVINYGNLRWDEANAFESDNVDERLKTIRKQKQDVLDQINKIISSVNKG